MDIKNLVPVNFSNQRVLTTIQVADVFGTSPARIRDNFKNHKKQFKEGIHFFKITGDALKLLKEQVSNQLNPLAAHPISKTANTAVLWTCQGVARLSKLFGTPNVLERFAELEQSYFNAAPNVPQIFNHPQFGQLRIFIINNEFFFVGIDVANILGYANPRDALATHVPDKFKRKDVANRDAVGGINFPTLINEAGLYKLIFRSKLPAAEKFSDWVCSEVLPAIRKTGSYVNKDFQPAQDDSKKSRRPIPEYATVYVVEFENHSVKIGYSSEFNRRIKELRKETKLDILDCATTPYMLLDDARKLESTLKAKFFDQSTGGEFFNIHFAAARSALRADNFDKIIAKADKLLAIADRMEPSNEKSQLLLQAADLLK